MNGTWRVSLSVVAGLIVLGTLAGFADTNVWEGVSSTNWATGTSWVGGAAPADDTTSDTAHFTAASSSQPLLTANRSVQSVVFDRSTTVEGTNYTLSLATSGTRLTVRNGSTVSMNTSVGTYGGNNYLDAGSRLLFNRNAPYGGTYYVSGNASVEYLGPNMSQFNYGVRHMGTGQVNFNGTLGGDFKMNLHDYVTLTIGTNASVGSSGSNFIGSYNTNTIIVQKNFDIRSSNSSGALNVGVEASYKNRTAVSTLQTGTNTLSVNAVTFCGITGVTGNNPKLVLDGGKLQVGGTSSTAVKGLLMTLHDGTLNTANTAYGVQDGITVTVGSTTNGGLIQVDGCSTFSHVSAVKGNPGALLQLTNTIALVNNGIFTNINTATTTAYTGLVVEADATLGGTGTFYMAANGTTNNAKFALVSGHVSPGLSNTVGTLTVTCSNLTWNSDGTSASYWTWTLANGAADKLMVNGDFKKGTGIKWFFDLQGATQRGTYVVAEWTGTTDFAANDFDVVNGQGKFTIVGKQLILTSGATIVWEGSSSTVWSQNAAWSGGVAPADNTAQDTALFTSDSLGLEPGLTASRSVHDVVFARDTTVNGGAAYALTLTNGATRLTVSNNKTVTMNVKVNSTGGDNYLGSGSRLIFNQGAPAGGIYYLADNSSKVEFKAANIAGFSNGSNCRGAGEALFDGTITSNLRMGMFDTTKLTMGANAELSNGTGIDYLATFGTNTVVLQKNVDLRHSTRGGGLRVGVDAVWKSRTVKTTLAADGYALSVNALMFCGISGVTGLNPMLIMDGGKLQLGGTSAAAAYKGLLLTDHGGDLNNGVAGVNTQEGIIVTLGATAKGGVIQVDERSTFSHVSAVNKNPGGELHLTNTVTLINNGVFTNINTKSTTAYTGLFVAQDATLGGTGAFYMAANGTTNNAKFAVISGHLSPGLSNTVGTLTVVCSNLTWNSVNSDASRWTWTLGPQSASDKLFIDGDFKKGTGSTFTFDMQGARQWGRFTLVEWTGANVGFSASDFEALNSSKGTISIEDKKLIFTVLSPGTMIRVY